MIDEFMDCEGPTKLVGSRRVRRKLVSEAN